LLRHVHESDTERRGHASRQLIESKHRDSGTERLQ
jgi:hypothetical protein